MSRIYLYDEHKTKGRIGGGNKGTKFQLQSKNRYDMRHGQFNFWRFLPLRFVRFPLLAFAYCSRPRPPVRILSSSAFGYYVPHSRGVAVKHATLSDWR